MGRMQRTKGATFERWLANVLRKLWPLAKRGIGQARSAGEVADVEGTPYWVEAKHHKVVNIRAAMRQAMEASDGRRPIVVSKCNNEEPLVTMTLDDWVELVERAQGRTSIGTYTPSGERTGTSGF